MVNVTVRALDPALDEGRTVVGTVTIRVIVEALGSVLDSRGGPVKHSISGKFARHPNFMSMMHVPPGFDTLILSF